MKKRLKLSKEYPRAVRWLAQKPTRNCADENKGLIGAVPGEELQRGFALISQQPEAGAKATNVKLKDVRRIYLSRIRYFLYYRVKEGRVEVLALWHSSRLKGPVLREPPNPPKELT